MKTKTFFAALAACVMMASCSKDASDDVNVPNGSPVEPTEVTLTFSSYDVSPMGGETRGAMRRAPMGGETRGAMRRAPVSIAAVTTHLDVWFYEGGSEVEAVHQSSTDDGFGTVSITLDKTKTYTLYAVAHKADGATLSDGVIAFTDDKVTHSMFYTTTFSPRTTTNLNCEMTRIVADFRLEITDDIPAECKSFRFTVAGIFDRWNVSMGGTHQLDRVSTISYGGTSAIFNVYAIVTDAQTTHDITVSALDDNGQEVQTRTFADVPLRNGYKTNYRGTFFIDTPMSMSFTVNDWNEYDTVEF